MRNRRPDIRFFLKWLEEVTKWEEREGKGMKKKRTEEKNN